ncbi:antA/AntB antirepressor family protein [Pediococcus pentosaceus]
MNELIKMTIDKKGQQVVDARDLHDFLEIGKRFTTWFEDMNKYGFDEGKDFFPISGESNGGRKRKDYAISINMAKELSMIQRTKKGKQAREYFIAVEEQFNSPEMIMARSLQFANQKMLSYQEQIQVMKPKADYFDDLVERKLLTNFRDTAKELHIGQKKFIDWLLEHKYVYRDKGRRRQLKHYAKYDNDLFEFRESASEWMDKAFVQSLITPKGRATFKLLLEQENLMSV